jgi:polyphosphate kinase 2 (PPK2 family)
MVIFDRSWYSRAGVERVMGFCTEEEYLEFLHTCPEFERMLQRSGIILIKYWFSVSDAEQERRFQQRIKDPTKRWKLSPMDLERWVEYSKAKDEMFAQHRHPAVILVRGQRRQQENRPVERDPSPALADSLQGPYTRAYQTASPRQKQIPRPPITEQNFVSEIYK